MASIDRRRTKSGENRWEVRYRAPDGSERSKSFRVRKDAQRYLVTVEADRARGSWIDPRDAGMTFREAAARWQGSNPNKRPTTRATEEGALEVHILPELGERRIGAITRSDVQSLVNGWAQKAAPRTVRRRFGVLSSVFNFAGVSLDRALPRAGRQAASRHLDTLSRPFAGPDQRDGRSHIRGVSTDGVARSNAWPPLVRGRRTASGQC